MALNQELLAKSNENWMWVEVMRADRSLSRYNTVVSRIYYSVFQLVKCVMVHNLEEHHDLPESHKMAMDAATGVHFLAQQYLTDLDWKLGNNYKDLVGFREQADYKKVPISKAAYDEIINYWVEKRNLFYNNIQQHGKLLI